MGVLKFKSEHLQNSGKPSLKKLEIIFRRAVRETQGEYFARPAGPSCVSNAAKASSTHYTRPEYSMLNNKYKAATNASLVMFL